MPTHRFLTPLDDKSSRLVANVIIDIREYDYKNTSLIGGEYLFCLYQAIFQCDNFILKRCTICAEYCNHILPINGITTAGIVLEPRPSRPDLFPFHLLHLLLCFLLYSIAYYICYQFSNFFYNSLSLSAMKGLIIYNWEFLNTLMGVFEYFRNV